MEVDYVRVEGVVQEEDGKLEVDEMEVVRGERVELEVDGKLVVDEMEEVRGGYERELKEVGC